jgi:hypothetical protein
MLAAAAPSAQEKAAPLRVGDAMPTLAGDFLTGRTASLPAAAAGKVALVMLGFTYDSRLAVERWGGWFATATTGRSDVTYFEVPMLGGAARLGRFFIDRGMRKNTPPAKHEQVITVYGNTAPWKARLGVTGDTEQQAWLLLVDAAGTIRWMHHGDFDQAAAARLQEVLAGLLPAGPQAAGPREALDAK